MSEATCRHYDEDDTGLPIGAPCGKPATHHSCCWAGDVNACEAHKCRCAQPTAQQRYEALLRDPSLGHTAESCLSRQLAQRDADLAETVATLQRTANVLDNVLDLVESGAVLEQDSREEARQAAVTARGRAARARALLAGKEKSE